ncbi:negative regulator of flagellin synthesis FlgM [Desulfobaculum xiamenense]|uniref:Negative regulator of flagellin synthesis n=1 Tax=Desulfobaculum xiamenense TaxID=995050 RepID=A0A846QNJ9_9BACT|nr:flagellar biosynthesis anti-sigma factor FlgM [Desulfobaculum xiamenense]NJB66975.1 negative regulator of flagellin synthesis FlgM [Desulfobaculum xiamenense]
MKVLGPLTGLKSYERLEKPGGTNGRSRAGSTTGTSRGDSVQLSNEGRLFSSALREAQAAPEVRRAKVNAIKAQVESGEYVPDSRKTAQKLVEEDLDQII